MIFSKNPKLNIQKGRNTAKSSVALIARYLILVSVGFVYLYPIIYMLLGSLLSPGDQADPTVKWLPTQWYFKNYTEAMETLDFVHSFLRSLIVAVGPALLQTAATAIIGFGFARFEFPLKNLWFVLVIATFIIPVDVTLVPRYVLYYQYGMVDTYLPAYLPAIFGQGIKSALFILVFYQFFRSYPISFDEAAELDGAGKLKVFIKIAVPMAGPAIVLSLLFSFIWYWNETSQFSLYFGSKLPTLPMQLEQFTARYEAIYGTATETGSTLSNATTLAGTTLSILPVIILFLVFQKQFIESIERSGITGE